MKVLPLIERITRLIGSVQLCQKLSACSSSRSHMHYPMDQLPQKIRCHLLDRRTTVYSCGNKPNCILKITTFPVRRNLRASRDMGLPLETRPGVLKFGRLMVEELAGSIYQITSARSVAQPLAPAENAQSVTCRKTGVRPSWKSIFSAGNGSRHCIASRSFDQS